MMVTVMATTTTLAGIKTEGAKKGAKEARSKKPWHRITSYIIEYILYYSNRIGIVNGIRCAFRGAFVMPLGV